MEVLTVHHSRTSSEAEEITYTENVSFAGAHLPDGTVTSVLFMEIPFFRYTERLLIANPYGVKHALPDVPLEPRYFLAISFPVQRAIVVALLLLAQNAVMRNVIQQALRHYPNTIVLQACLAVGQNPVSQFLGNVALTQRALLKLLKSLLFAALMMLLQNAASFRNALLCRGKCV